MSVYKYFLVDEVMVIYLWSIS